MGFGHMGMGLFWWILIIGIIVVVIRLAFVPHGMQKNNDEENALEILDKRYAKGELTDEEYKRMKSKIRGK